MEDYFDRVETQLIQLTEAGAHLRRWPGPRFAAPGRALPGAGRLPAILAVSVSAAVAVGVAAVLLVSARGPAARPVQNRVGLRVISPPRDPGQVVPATYAKACASEAIVCPAAPARIPMALRRAPLHFPALAPGARCPVSTATIVRSSYVTGTALGRGPVLPLIENRGDFARGVVQLGGTDVPGWKALDTVWVSARRYDGPFVIRAQRLDGPGQVRLGVAAPPASPAPLAVPSGPTLNTGAGWRTLPSGLWVRGPGCYAWQVDGLTFSEIIVVRAVLPAR
jgi:hypothetical protein